MTTITKTNTKTGMTVRISGHAGAARKNGYDLCCAAVSMLAYTLMKILSDIRPKNLVITRAEADVFVSFDFFCLRAFPAFAAVKTVMAGYKLLEEKYPENVRIVSGVTKA